MGVGQGLVVPVLAAQEQAEVAFPEFEVMDALEDQRVDVAVLVVGVAIITRTGGCQPKAGSITRCDQLWVLVGHTPAGTDRKLRIKAALDLAPLEFNGRCGKTQRARRQQQPNGCLF